MKMVKGGQSLCFQKCGTAGSNWKGQAEGQNQRAWRRKTTPPFPRSHRSCDAA